ncbi:MAG: hypothetical protein ACFFCW_39420 [Candidatus Hodarchaeota archaeon]
MCQLKYLQELAQESAWLDDFYTSLRRKLIWIYVKTKSLGKILSSGFIATDKKQLLHKSQQPQIYPNDTVRVRSKEKITDLLDHGGIYKGCTFIDEMYDYCGKEYRVLAKVDNFYDESKQKLCRCKDVFILDGLHCSGRRWLYLNSCDLRCFFFWHKDLLEKT